MTCKSECIITVTLCMCFLFSEDSVLDFVHCHMFNRYVDNYILVVGSALVCRCGVPAQMGSLERANTNH